LLTFLLADPKGTLGDEHFPYAAYVNADEVYARSGPGKNYYPTQQLARGDQVEVYRHDPGGWFAIRPPEGSFSWVAADFVKPGEDGLGVVVGDRVAARVGSSLSDIRDVIQVRLNRGEPVELLGVKEFNPGPSRQKWYRIAPPSGEFRWVHGSFLVRELPKPEPDEARSQRNLLLSPDESIPESMRAAENNRAAGLALVDHQEVDPQMRASPPDRQAADNDPLAAKSKAKTQAEDAERIPRITKSRLTGPADASSRPPAGSREEQFAQELDQLNLELSAMAAEDPKAWVFEDLLARASAAVQRGQTAVERGRARLILNKIEKFSDIKRRMDLAAQSNASSRPLSRTAASPSSVAADVSQRYDGVGRLARVNSPSGNVPTYALTDSSGAIRYFVTPSPGVNLRHYLGQEVGIIGSVGYVPELARQNVTARRITVLGGGELRR
jgi:SH3-like domain-containing protein